jgi:transcriptional regulator with XRE-family HTH domain
MSSEPERNDAMAVQEHADPALVIGERLAAHRARRGMTVSGLAREIGVSPSLISQIERGQSRPSVSTLFALAEVLHVPVDAFFRDAPVAPVPAAASEGRHHRYVVRAPERAAIDIEGGVRWERLTPTTLDSVEFMELIYSPGSESHESLYRHPGFEMVLVLSGRLTIFVGFDRHDLQTGDSMSFPSTVPHRYVNESDEETHAVTVILPDGVPEPAHDG